MKMDMVRYVLEVQQCQIEFKTQKEIFYSLIY